MNGYWWNGKSEKGVSWTSWELLCQPKNCGGLGFRRLREFNLSIFAKQAWRIFTEPNTLAARVFKARYFPRGNFLNAKLGGSPSFIWRSLFETQSVIKARYKWRIGDGKSINIWEGPWLPDDANPRVSTPQVPGLDCATVDGLLVENGGGVGC
ncbi:unnamed protein product [Cuscuta europaea]|nr:unnamed protein product [Cuscuta europaea]